MRVRARLTVTVGDEEGRCDDVAQDAVSDGMPGDSDEVRDAKPGTLAQDTARGSGSCAGDKSDGVVDSCGGGSQRFVQNLAGLITNIDAAKGT